MNKKILRGEITRAVLMGVGLAGVLGVAFVCPNLLQLVPVEFRRRYRYPQVWQAVKRLDKKGWIVARQTVGGWKITLAKRGWVEFRAYELGEKKLAKPRHWDQKWRFLIFDIPEKRRGVREQVRKFLRTLDFQRVQDSVWVHPYECREVLDLLRTRYGIRFEALYLCVESLDNDRWLRKQFGLK